jgi:hypothetical protein
MCDLDHFNRSTTASSAKERRQDLEGSDPRTNDEEYLMSPIDSFDRSAAAARAPLVALTPSDVR